MEEEGNKDQMSEEKFEKMVETWIKSKFEGKKGDKMGEGYCDCKHHKKGKMYKTGNGAGAGVYFLGLIGAIVYYIGASVSFWDGVVGILKSLVWPAFMVHGLLKFLGL